MNGSNSRYAQRFTPGVTAQPHEQHPDCVAFIAQARKIAEVKASDTKRC
jgi:hypothetical protein